MKEGLPKDLRRRQKKRKDNRSFVLDHSDTWNVLECTFYKETETVRDTILNPDDTFVILNHQKRIPSTNVFTKSYGILYFFLKG